MSPGTKKRSRGSYLSGLIRRLGAPHVFFQFTDTVILFRHERLGKLSFVQLMIHAVSGNQILMQAARVSFR